MRRCLSAPFLAILLVLGAVGGLAAPAAALDTVELTIVWADGSLSTRRVPADTATATATALQDRADVRLASVPVPMSAEAVRPDDNGYPEQWGIPASRVDEVWERTTGSDEVVVAVLDSGVQASHPDLVGAVLPGRDFVDGDGDPDDENGHGTTVAGVVAARGDNRIGVAGACWSCKILPVRVLDEHGAGRSTDIARGILWAADNGADVINLSLSGDQLDPALLAAVTYARAKGIVVVASSGNEGVSTVTYPSAISGVVSVGASDRNGNRAGFSNHGSWVDVAAPGVGIVTTAIPSRYLLNAQGTSYSAPLVAGIVALARSAFPAASRSDLESMLVDTAVPVTGRWVAAGRVDAEAYVDALAEEYRTITPVQVKGLSRVETAVALSRHVRQSSGTVILARADSPADALAAAPLAGKLDAPVLLTSGTALSAPVRDEIARLGATEVWLMGGPGALAPAVETAVRATGVGVRRLSGTSRFDTARLIAEEVGGSEVYVTDGIGWADAVAVSGLAAFTRRPVLLTRPGSLPAETATALAALGATGATVIGGTGAVSDEVLDQIEAAGATPRRLSGSSRYATSERVADEMVAAGAEVASTWLATGVDWPDALAAGPAAASRGGVLLLLHGRDLELSPTVAPWLSSRRSQVRELVVVGGDTTVLSSTVSSLTSLLLG